MDNNETALREIQAYLATQDDLIADLLYPSYVGTKTLTEILATGIKHAGGLAQLAQAEQDGTLFGGPPCASADQA